MAMRMRRMLFLSFFSPGMSFIFFVFLFVCFSFSGFSLFYDICG